jgi:prepilin-type processing-associated H-X9-DG protein
VELLVILAVIAILAALLLPAVQSAREAARRATCASNLRQIGLAVAQYESQYAMMPPILGGPTTLGPGGPSVQRLYSVFTRLLPMLEQTDLANCVNFEIGVQDPYWTAATNASPGNPAHATAMATVLGVLLCPSDGRGDESQFTGGTSYRANLGTERWSYSVNGPFMRLLRMRRPASIRDGLSNTVAFSEKLRGGINDYHLDPRVHMIDGSRGLPYTIDQSIASCLAPRTRPFQVFHPVGLTWFVGSLPQTLYNHTIAPNGTMVDCVNQASLPSAGHVGARSDHPGGVHVLLCDGSVRFAIQTISLQVWRALGTCDGGEPISYESLER